jgi:hypothetical protein
LRNETSANGKPSFAESESLFLEQRQSTFSSSPRHTFPRLTSIFRLKRHDQSSEADQHKENFMALTTIPRRTSKEEPEALNMSAAERAEGQRTLESDHAYFERPTRDHRRYRFVFLTSSARVQSSG